MARIARAEVLGRLGALLETRGPGERLPPERGLAAELGCSRETLRACLDALEAEGQVWRHVGQGTFTGPRPRGLPVRDRLLVEATSPVDLMEARLLVEPPVAAAAAQRASATDAAYLRERAEAGRRAPDRATCEQSDDAFHRAVAEVAGNPVLIGLLAYLSSARRRSTWQREWERTYRRVGTAEFTGPHSDQHLEVVDAIAAGDSRGAERAMREHLETIRAEMSRP